MDRNIIILIAAALVALATWFLVGMNQPADEGLEAPTPSSSLSDATEDVAELYDFGDAPEYDEVDPKPETYLLFSGDIHPQFPTAVNFEGDTWYVSHDSPFSQIYLGEYTSVEPEPELVDADDDDGLVDERLEACAEQNVELNVTVPFSYESGTPLYLNALFDWNQNGEWGGASDRCGFDVDEWAIQNVRLDQNPYFLIEPGIYTVMVPMTAGDAGRLWSRFTVTTEEIIPTESGQLDDNTQRAQLDTPLRQVANENKDVQVAMVAAQGLPGGWHGNGQFGPGETEDYIIDVIREFQGNHTTPFSVLQGPPLSPTEQKEKQERKKKEQKEKAKCNAGRGNGDENAECDPGNSGGKNCGGDTEIDENSPDKCDKDSKDNSKDSSPGNSGNKNKNKDDDDGSPGNSGDKGKGKDDDDGSPGNSGDKGKGKDKDKKK